MKELLVISLAGSKYGVWKEDFISVRDVSLVHRLPESPEWFSGISMIDGRTAQLFDLSACMGHSPFDNSGSGLALVMSEGDILEGFVADAGGDRDVADSDIFPLPAHMVCPDVDTCVFHNGEIIPVIKIGELYKRVCGPEWNAPVFALYDTLPETNPERTDVLRIFMVKDKVFAVDNDLIENVGVLPDHINVLPAAPDHVDGIVFDNGNVRAVINIGEYMGYDASTRQGTLLFLKEGPALLVGSDMGIRNAGPVIPLPPLASSELLQYAVVREGDIIPVLNIHALMSLDPKGYAGKKYVPRSRFHTLFGQKDVKVLEFALAGMTQSMPDSQVEDIVEMRLFRPLPGMHPLLQGVAGHEDGLLPVLDLALCFGRRTKVGADAGMILMKNGNFRALLLTEDIPGRRLLLREDQREVPINLPHRYVYGCYIHENTVRLILDVETIAVRSREYAVSGDFHILTETLAGGGLIEESGDARGADVEMRATGETGIWHAEQLFPVLEIDAKDEGQAEREIVQPEALSGDLESEQESGREKEAVTRFETGEEEPSGVTDDRGSAEKKPLSEPSVSFTGGPAPDESEMEKHLPVSPEEPEPQEVEESPEPAVSHENRTDKEYAVDYGPKADDPGKQKPGMDMQEDREIERELPVCSSGTDTEGEQTVAEKPSGSFDVRESEYPKYADNVGQGERGYREAEGTGYGGDEEQKTPHSFLMALFAGRKRTGWYLVIVLFLALAAYLAILSPGPPVEEPGETVVKGMNNVYVPKGNEAAPEKDSKGERPSEAQPPDISQGGPEHKETTMLMELETKSGEISMRINSGAPANAHVYEVKKGDTLWHIAERFTGNPFHYHYIAADSEIRNPDLIFPGQKVLVRVTDEKK